MRWTNCAGGCDLNGDGLRFLFGWRRARDLFRVNKTEFSWEIFTPNENRYVNGTEPRCGGRKRDRRSALWQLRSEFEKAVSSQEGKKFSSVVRESRRCLSSSIRTNISKDIHGKARTSAGALHTRVSDNKLLTNKSRSSRRAPKKMGNKVSLEDELVNLRITSKQMQRSAKKCEKNEKAAIEKLKKVRLGWLWFMEHRFPIIFR